jgi:hypothetical protein
MPTLTYENGGFSPLTLLFPILWSASGFSITASNTALTSFLELNSGRAAIIPKFQVQPENGTLLAVTLLSGRKRNLKGTIHAGKKVGDPNFVFREIFFKILELRPLHKV